MVTFRLKEPNGKNKTIIYLTYQFNDRRLKISTGQMILPAHWNKETHRPRKAAPRAATLKTLLDKWETIIQDVHLKMLSELEPVTPGTLKRRFQIELDRGPNRETFTEYIDRYIKESKHSTATKNIFRSTQKLIRNFPGQKDFYDIDLDWWKRFQSYMERTVKKNKKGEIILNGYAANYIGKTVVYIRQFLNAAVTEGVTKSTLWKTDYHPPSEEADTIYLNTDELLDIYRVDLPRYLSRARDRFLIGAFTALRFSDFSVITHDDIISGLMKSRNIKTGIDIVVPVHWVVEEIMQKYPAGLPAGISNQNMNDYLKLIAARAGIKQKVVKRRTQGGVRTKQTFEKWELVTTHTARRSAATNMYIAGIPAISIMLITGHKTEKSFLKYIRISREENARLIASHAYFQRPNEKTEQI